MMSLFQYLCDVKKYSDYESEETVLRREYGFEIPPRIKADINDYYDYRFKEFNKKN